MLVTAGRELEVSPAMLEVARCDARLESDAFHRATWTVTARIRNQVLLFVIDARSSATVAAGVVEEMLGAITGHRRMYVSGDSSERSERVR